MKRAAVLTLALVACGPSKAERAFQACQAQMTAKNWEAAVSACGLAMSLAPKNVLYQTAYADALVGQWEASLAQIHDRDERTRTLEALQASAAAANAAADAAILREARARTEAAMAGTHRP